MVRIKQRYLLVNILYPDPSSWPAPPPSTTAATSKPDKSQAHLRIHAPTADTLSPGLLSKLIREKVADLFGDWGIGKLGGVVSGAFCSHLSFTSSQQGQVTDSMNSKIPLPRNLNSHNPLPTPILPSRLDGAHALNARSRIHSPRDIDSDRDRNRVGPETRRRAHETVCVSCGQGFWDDAEG